MAGFGGFNEKKKKKKGKQDATNTSSAGGFSTKPVFVAPKIIEKVRKEK